MRWLVLAAMVAAARPADARGCHETSHVVGYHHCSRFGMWSRDVDEPRIAVELAFMHRRFLSEPFVLTGDPRAVDTPTLDLRTSAILPGVTRILVGVGPTAYLGGELGGGWLSRPPGTGIDPLQTFFGTTHALAGARVNPFLGFSAGAELAGGGRLVGISKCMTKPCPSQDSDLQVRSELEARVLVDLWVTPQLSIGGGYGHSLIDRDDWTWLVYIGLHARPMDGMR